MTASSLSQAHDTLALVELIQRLQTEARTATEEERARLASWMGWGPLAPAFVISVFRFSRERGLPIETDLSVVPRLYARVRRGAKLDRSLAVLSAVKDDAPEMTTRSGLMLGLGEKGPEVLDLLSALRAARVDIVTIGQYLRPSRENLPVEEYVRPAVFERYREAGERMGFRHVFAGPFVRSSYRAEEALHAASSPSPPGRGPGRGENQSPQS